VLVRGALVLIAAAAIVFGVTRLRDADACSDAKNAAIAVALGHAPPGGPQPIADKVVAHCRDSSDLAAAGGALARAGDVAVAEGLARRAVSRDPRGYLGWASLAIVLQRRHEPAASRAAARRALALNPRYAAAQQLAGPARGGAPSGP
jgi:tetratricopeptide (TPR) repeat protein